MKSFGKRPDKETVRKSAQYRNGRFMNPVSTQAVSWRELPEVLLRYAARKAEKAPQASYKFEETKREIIQATDSTGIYLNWLGHAAVLICAYGKYFLLDPALGRKASPFSLLGPERFAASPILPRQLPPLEAVVISHDHYDHLDYPTIVEIRDKTRKFIVPTGVGAHLRHWGVAKEKIVEKDWGETYEYDDYSLTAAPARHFSGRLLARDNTLWCSWVMRFGTYSIYFAGDSGYFEGYIDIGEKYGPFDLSLMPIGAYDKAWQDIHLNPEEAVHAFFHLKSGQFFPTHWGTFDLALHSWYEPIQWLGKLAAQYGIKTVTPPPGEWVHLFNHHTSPDWWVQYSAELGGIAEGHAPLPPTS